MEISISNVHKIINNKKILNDINLHVEKGSVFGLVGPNGAGKTTLVRLILNIYNVSSGEIIVNDVNNKDKEFEAIKKHIGFLLDNIGLFKDLSAWDNLEFFHRIYYPNSTANDRNERINNLFKKFDLYDNRHNRINFFSRGMKQRLALARSLINEPDLLILDEPSRGLDLEGQVLLRNFIKGNKEKNCTIFVNSHDLDELQKVCTHIAFIKDGKIVSTGRYDELRTKFSGNSYLLKSRNIVEVLKHVTDKDSINWIINNKDEVIITVNVSNFDISEWLFQNKIKVMEIRKLNSDLEDLYKNIIINDESNQNES